MVWGNCVQFSQELDSYQMVWGGRKKSILKPANEGKSHVLQLPQGSYIERSFYETAAQVAGGTAVSSGEWKEAELLWEQW